MTLQKSTQDQLRQFVETIERLEEEKKGIADDIREKFAEAKAVGFDVKTLRKVIKLRKQSKTDRDEQEAMLATYMSALGMLGEQFGDLPMGEWARDKVRAIARSHGISNDIADEVALEGRR